MTKLNNVYKALIVIMLILTVTLPAYGKSNIAAEYANFTDEQRAVIYQAYADGQPYGMGVTLAAIAWQESMAGKWRISTNHDDVGIYHVNLYWYLKSIKVRDTPYTRSEHATILLLNPDIELKYVIALFKDKLRRANNDFELAWQYYNGSKKYGVAIKEKYIFLYNKLNK